MPAESFIIRIDGEEVEGLYGDLIRLEIELSDEAPASFRLVLGTALQTDGSWKHLDDEHFRLWHEVAIDIGFDDAGPEEVLTGFITEMRPIFDPDPALCTFEVVGLDKSVQMDREEHLKDWPNKKDSDIASEILSSYGFIPNVTATEVIHDEALSTVIQRETDYQFLQRLALRNGFGCFVEGDAAIFGPVPVDPAPQPVLAAHFGDETTLRSFTTTVDGMRPAQVAMFQVDRFNKEVLTATVEEATQDPLGDLLAADLLTGGIAPAKVYVAKNAATGSPEMEALCQGLFQEGAYFVEGAGEIDAMAYGHVLRPRRLVIIKGVGETYSGTYYVSFVRHAFTRGGYSQAFRIRRDGLMPTGDEDFAGGDGLFGF